MGIIDIFMPQNFKCAICGVETAGINFCDNCRSHFHYISGKVCEKCGGRIIGGGDLCVDCKSANHEFVKTYCVLDYDGIVVGAIAKLKNNGIKSVAYGFSYIMLDRFKALDIPFDMIIPVPMHGNRLKERGFNQTEILCNEIERYYGRVRKDILLRVRDTPHQTGLNKENRESNLENAFKITNKSTVKGKIILLVDDIYTTGTTLSQCAKELNKAGAKEVYGLCLCRSVIKATSVLDEDRLKSTYDDMFI